MATPPKLKSPKRPGKNATSGPDAKEARRQAIEPDVKSTGALGTGPVANPKCALPESVRIIVVDDHPLDHPHRRDAVAGRAMNVGRIVFR